MPNRRLVTGVFRTPNGTIFANKSLTFLRDPRITVSQGGAVIVDEPFVVQTDGSGAMSQEMEPGNYLVMVRLSDADRYFAFGVPEGEGSFDAADGVELLPAVAMPLVQQLVGQALDAAQRAEAAATLADSEGNATIALNAANAAANSATSASTDANRAETARDAAFVNADVFADIATGLAATGVGDQFRVVAGDDIVPYRHDAGPVATELPGRVKTAQYLNDRLFDDDLPGFALAFRDGAGAVAGGVADDGTLVSNTARANTLIVTSVQHIADAEIDDSGEVLFGQVQDGAGSVASGYTPDGTFHVAAIQVDEINGTSAENFGGGKSRSGGRFLTQDVGIITTGQSLGEGSTPATSITAAQEFDSVGFAARAADYSVANLLPLTTTNCGVPSRGENPMFGTAGAIKALIGAENGLAPADLTYRLIGVNTAYSGFKIDELEKGTDPYNDGLAAMTRAKVLADAAERTFSVRAVTWTQGESDAITPTPLATYRDALIQLAADYDADLRAITGQAEPVYLITYQTGVRNRTIAHAQLEAAQLSPRIVMACPMYQFEYGDDVHIVAASSKWLGGYYGLAYKRSVIDALPHEPLWPVAADLRGSVIDVIFNKSGLVFDSTALPEQANQGFSVVDGSDNAQTISSVAIIQPNRVRLTMSGTPAVGWRVRYGAADMTGRADDYEGGGGNLRDRAGDVLIYNGNPMHNWCVLFDWSL